MAVFRKIVAWAVGVPLALVIIVLAVANRASVRFSLDPISPDNPVFALDLPLYILLFAAVLAGILAGGLVTWLGQRKWRRACREARRDAAHWRDEALRTRPAAGQSAPVAPVAPGALVARTGPPARSRPGDAS